MSSLAGRVAIVTGASRGIGKGCALELGAAGATVYVTGRSTSEADHPLPGTVGATAHEIDELGGTGIAVAVDHRDDDAVASLFARVQHEHGRLDVLVNNAFIVTNELTSGLPFWEVPLSNWDDMIDVGTRSAYVATVFAARLMVPRRAGLVVNVSGSGANEYAWSVAYGVGKCALDRITADTALELRPHGVQVVSVWPGFVRTERIDVGMQHGALPEGLDVSAAESPRFTGRAVVALATDPDSSRWSGRAVAVARRSRRTTASATSTAGCLPARCTTRRRTDRGVEDGSVARDDHAEVASTLRTTPHGVVDTRRDAQDAAGAVAPVVEPQLAVGDDEDLAFVVSVHQIAVLRRVLDVLHPRDRVDADGQGLHPDAGVAVFGPREVVLVCAEDLSHSLTSFELA